MTGREREARRLHTLLARMREDWRIAETVHARSLEALERVNSEGADNVTVGAVAVYLQNVYSAIEQILSRIATEIDGAQPSGSEWHRDLLDQMAIDVPDVRPPLLDKTLSADLDLLRRFRHVVRHAYADAFDWNEMQDTLRAEKRIMDRIPDALNRFEGFLHGTIAALEREPAEDV